MSLESSCNDLVEFIDENVIGKDSVFQGPFGQRKVVYCDYTASGKPLRCIESYITESVLPMYANTHTTTCATALQMAFFRQEARDIVRNSVRASEHDAVIFTGNGTTGAIHKLMNALNLDKPPIVFCGPYEHHSNLVPWREISTDVIRISESKCGINLDHLEAVLKQYSQLGLPMLGCFSAASNVTGQLCDTIAVSVLLHKYKALAFWDYATAAPYVNIDMHPYVEHGDASKDAIFISPHKFVGGVSTPGVLVAAKEILRNPVPSECGGGTVFFVSENSHKFLEDHEMREEGGTPDIVGSVRCGLCFKLKNDVGCEEIMKRETSLFKSVASAWSKSKNIEILGLPEDFCDDDRERLAIFSFMIRHHDSGLYLHYSFVASLLNDLFGIQARGGCVCAGPYAQDLLGISPEKVREFERALTEDSRLDRRHLRRFREYSPYEVLRPGFVRLSIPYFCSEKTKKFIIDAVLLIAESAWTMLPQYTFDPDTGEWRHIKQRMSQNRKWLSHITFNQNKPNLKEHKWTKDEDSGVLSMKNCLEQAKQIFDKAKRQAQHHLPDHNVMFDDFVELKWFLSPSEAHAWITNEPLMRSKVKASPPFTVRRTVRELSKEEIIQSATVALQLLEKASDLKSNGTVARPAFRSWRSAKSQTTNNSSKSSNSNSKVTNSKLPKEKNTDIVEHIPTPVGKPGFVSPPKRLMKLSIQAIDDFGMIQNGDKVLVCLSGGKDSLSLLHTLRQYQFYAKKSDILFELGAVTVDPKSSSYDPSPLKPYLAALGLPYFFEEQGILDHAMMLPEVTSICAFCSRMKRGRLYHCARREGWNVLAMGQHLDDLAESFLMSFFQNGLLRTMKANYTVKEGDLRVIRPFSYVREKDTRDFAENSHLPVIPENCPACFEAPKERHRMKQLLASLEVVHPKLFFSIKEALKPLMSAGRDGLKSLFDHDNVCREPFD